MQCGSFSVGYILEIFLYFRDFRDVSPAYNLSLILVYYIQVLKNGFES